tara:strand:- start:360 stop:581 length:222 start_codon:yes stop_codon:yes gene_type:complete
VTFEEKKKLWDELHDNQVTRERHREIFALLDYPKIITKGNAHADEIMKAWRDYWEGNPPHPNWGWGEPPKHLK